MLWWIAAVVFVIFVYTYIIKPQQHWQKLNVPHIKPWPFFGNMAPIVFRRKTIVEWLQDIYNSKNDKTRYVGFYSFFKPTLLIRDLNLIKQICIKEFDHFSDHRNFISEEAEPIFGKGLFSLKGQRWRNMRSTLSPAFTGSKMRAMFILMSECAEQFVDYFSKEVDRKTPFIIEMKDVFSRIANDVIATTAFGIKCDSLNDMNNEFYLMGKEATNFSGIKGLKFFGYNISPTLMKVFKIRLFSDKICNFFQNIILSTIKTREKQGIVRPDMIHLLMEARKGKLRHEETSKKVEDDAGFATVEESHIGKNIKQALIGNKLLAYFDKILFYLYEYYVQELSDDDVTAQALLFFFAGFDSISTEVSHMTYELALNPDVQVKLQEEIDVTLRECNGKINYEALMKMKYMDMVLCETLRKWPGGIILDRVCVDSYTIQPENPGEEPLTLVKDDVVWFPVYAIHRDPKYYPNPDKFDPERFSDENKDSINPHAYVPFGVGPRNCIGSRFALLEVKAIVFHLLSKFNLVIVEKSQVPLRLSKTQFNLNAEKGFWLGLTMRN